MASFAIRRYVRGFVTDSGGGSISGVIRVGTTPVADRLVYLFASEGLRLLQATRSASDGSYTFLGVKPGKEYVVMATDPTGAHNAEVADRITP